jgi:DNA-binding transcriptional ArsR family regulator
MHPDPLSAAFGALSDPTRRTILARLARGEASLNELAEPFGMSIQAVSKHLKVLETSGLISRSKVAQRRPARLAAKGLEPLTKWVDENRQFWEASFDRLDTYLTHMQQEAGSGSGS